MSHNSGSDKDISESVLEYYEYKYYKELKNGRVRVKISDSVHCCPFCHGNRIDYPFQELLQHASGVGRSCKRELKERAKHLALENYMERHLTVKAECSKPGSLPALHKKNQLFVWPAMGILANIQVELKHGRYVGASGSKLRKPFEAKGFDPIGVYPLWDHSGDSGFAILEFKKDWIGFKNAMMFEKDFKVRKCGMKDYLRLPVRDRRDKLFGWVARDDDYNSRGLISEYLRKHGDLISVSENEAEEQRMDSMLISNLTDISRMKRESLKEMQSKYSETSTSLSRENNRMIKSYNEARQNLEARRKELEQQEEQLQQREQLNEGERKRQHHDKKMKEHASLGREKAEESMLRFAKQHKREKELLHENEWYSLKTSERIKAVEKELKAQKARILYLEAQCHVMRCEKRPD